MKILTLFLLAFLNVLCGCSLHNDIDRLENRMSLLEHRNARSEKYNKELKFRLEEKDLALRNQSAELHAMHDQLKAEMQLISGRIDETDYLLKQKLSDSDKITENRLKRIDEATGLNKNRIIRLEQYLNFESGKNNLEIKSKPQSRHELSENELYTVSKQAFDAGDFKTAREGFKNLMNKFPKSAHADNAQFWIGESYYSEKWYEKAILEYQKVIEKYPKGNKMPASLLKQGFAFLNLGDKANARLILKGLVKKYSKSNEAKIATKKLKKL
ncbi:MAG: tol-pal system protein YbgF [Desulfobacteraceae bacterium]|nr:tol-pal system protein YbgF [Desulfobacteraceae bacterium]MBC2720432.1 tol-pal system protein YbgF [Desulfobacteraceae bacterium]